jgi:hypothetical protein
MMCITAGQVEKLIYGIAFNREHRFSQGACKNTKGKKLLIKSYSYSFILNNKYGSVLSAAMTN